jgi:hypothetical protein
MRFGFDRRLKSRVYNEVVAVDAITSPVRDGVVDQPPDEMHWLLDILIERGAIEPQEISRATTAAVSLASACAALGHIAEYLIRTNRCGTHALRC